MTEDKILGMFLGIAIGDALYAPVETWTAEKISETRGRLTDYIDPSSHKWMKGRPIGSWTDDTQLTLLVADSLLECGEFNIQDLARRHVEYLEREGNLGFGKTTFEAIKRLQQGIHWAKSGVTSDPKLGVGNALPMKIAPLAAYSYSPFFSKYLSEPSLFKTKLRDFTLMTHYTQMAVKSALAHIEALQFCLYLQLPFGRDDYVDAYNFQRMFIEAVIKAMELPEHMLKGVPFGGNYDDIRGIISTVGYLPLDKLDTADFIKLYGEGKGYVYHTLPFCYAFFLKNPYSIETLYDVGNAGGDTDTNASIVGGMLGALNGASIFPQRLIDGLWQKERIIDTAKRFYRKFWVEG